MIKSIYTLALDDEYPSIDTINKFREFVEFIYEELNCGVYDKERSVLIHSNNLKENNYYEKDNVGRFESQNIYCQPLVYNDILYGITVCDSEIDFDMLDSIITRINTLMKCNFNMKIDKISYYAKDENDEDNRRKAILKKMISNKIDKVINNDNKEKPHSLKLAYVRR